MPVFAADVLPDASGRNLGSPPQRWNVYAQNLEVLGTLNYQTGISPTGAIYVATSPTVAGQNTTNAQALSSCTVPAGLLNATGKVLRGTMGGFFVIQSGQAPQFSLDTLFGGQSVSGTTTPALAAGTYIWRVQWELAVYVPGTAGQVYPSGTMIHSAASGTDLGTPLINWNLGRLTQGPVDLTVNQPLFAECSFTTNTSPSNSCTQMQFIVEVLN